jgi:hypothetical protein
MLEMDEDAVYYSVFKLIKELINNFFDMTNSLVKLNGEPSSFKACLRMLIEQNKVYYHIAENRSSFEEYKLKYLEIVKGVYPERIAEYSELMEKFYKICIIYKKNMDELKIVSPRVSHVFSEIISDMGGEISKIFQIGSDKLPIASFFYGLFTSKV